MRFSLSPAVAVLALLISFGVAAQDKKADPKKLALTDLAWLGGCWKANEKESRVNNIEQWSQPFANVMVGVGVEQKNGKASSWEHMRIEARNDGSIVYTAKPHNQKEANFTLTSTDADMLTFENPKHDFPQKITYRREKNGNLEMRIDGELKGEKRAALFPMVRTNCN